MKRKEIDFSTVADRILLVDDDAVIRSMVSRFLRQYGLEVDLAADGRKAVELLRKRQYGLVVTDIVMPEMDGMALTIYIMEHYPDIDVLVISGHSEQYKFSDIIAAGATDFISKPFKQDEFKAKLQRIFRERLLLTEIARGREKEKTFFLHIVESLAISLDSKDKYTHGHSRRVTNLSLQLAISATGEGVDFELLRLCGVLHDIGKIGVPDKILGKTESLTPEEFAVIKKHPEQGAQILQPMQSDSRIGEISKIIRHHHERYDGNGYPDGLAGREIPYLSRIIAITDSYDAMTSDRPYRKGMAVATAIEEIRKNSGTQFDPLLTAAFVSLIEAVAGSEPCPLLETCAIFPQIVNDVISKAYETQYCCSNFKACARYSRNTGKRKKSACAGLLLPDGSIQPELKVGRI